MRDYLTLLRARPRFRRLWAAELVSLVGDWFTVVAVSLLTLGDGDHVVLLALSFVAHSLPQALLAPVAGPLADFFDRRRALLWTALAESLVTWAMVGAAATGRASLVPLLVLARSVLGAMREPAAAAALPRLVDASELVRANALLSATWSAAFAIGMSLGGVVAGYRADLALAIDAASFGVAALVLAGLPAMEPDVAPRSLGLGALLSGMRDALRHTTRDRALLRAVLGKAPVAVAGGGAWVLMNLATKAHPFLGTAGTTLGVLQGLRGLSTGIGPVVAERLGVLGASRGILRFSASAGALGGMALFVLARGPAEMVSSAMLWGACAGANWVLTTSEMQELGPRDFLGRLSAIDTIAWSLGMCAAALLTAVAVERTADATAPTWAALSAGALLYVALEVVTRPRVTRADRVTSP
jgi:predicted MFS family arabinose efflux permease